MNNEMNEYRERIAAKRGRKTGRRSFDKALKSYGGMEMVWDALMFAGLIIAGLSAAMFGGQK